MTGAPLRTVLVVDDHPPIRLMLRCWLEDAGLGVDEATGGTEALRMTAERRYDGVVLDQRMPDLTGLEVAERLSADDDAPPLLLYSAYMHPSIAAAAQDLGVTVCDKLDGERLAAQLTAVLERRAPMTTRLS